MNNFHVPGPYNSARSILPAPEDSKGVYQLAEKPSVVRYANLLPLRRVE